MTVSAQLLTLETLPRYLLQRQELDSCQILSDPEFAIVDRSRRNSNFTVTGSEVSPILVKQPRGRLAHRGTYIEARTLETLQADPILAAGPQLTPKFRFYDSENAILGIQLITPATTLLKFHYNYGEPEFPAEASHCVALAVADLHQALARANATGQMPFLAESVAGSFNWEAEAWLNWDELDTARKDLVRLTSTSGVLDDRQKVLSEMQERATPAHNDLRWENIVITEGEASSIRPLNLRIVDWETCGLRDIAYDVAFYLGEYLRFSALTTGFLEDGTTMRRFQLDALHNSAATFLTSYCRANAWNDGTSARFARRVQTYLPYCLLTMAFEAAIDQKKLPAASRALLDQGLLAKNDPRTAMTSFFGLEAIA